MSPSPAPRTSARRGRWSRWRTAATCGAPSASSPSPAGRSEAVQRRRWWRRSGSSSAGGARGGVRGDVVRAILDETAVPRLRLTSIAPWDLDERLLDLWRDRRLCRHLHLSLQSGATATLRRMRRPYTAEAYLVLLGRVRAAVPGVAVTTDVIVGFPGETADEFAASLATVEAANFAKIHVFPYSPRPGTTAAGMPDQVPPEEKKERMARMLAAADRAEHAFRTAHLGTRQTVLWERP